MAHAKIKGTRKGLVVKKTLWGDGVLHRHKLYETLVVDAIENPNGWDIFLNTGGWKTNHTKNCMNDFLSQFNLGVVQRNFTWYLVSNKYSIHWDFTDDMNITISYENHELKIYNKPGVPNVKLQGIL